MWPEGTTNATFRGASKRLRFQLGQADKFRAGVGRSGLWFDFIVTTLREHGVPTELAALPLVESSFNPKAYSRVGAAGLWQFTRGTGRRYMRIDHVVDERMDPHRASIGAAQLLRDNYRRLGAWPLAITAYNHGVSGIARAVRVLHTKDIGVISRRYSSRTFGFASRNFYAEFLAALEVSTDASSFFGEIEREKPVDYATITVDYFAPATSIAAALGVPLGVLKDHNRALRPSVWNGAKYVPRGFALKIPRHEVRVPIAEALAQIPRDQRYAQQHRDRFYKVRRGDTLSKIARRYRVRDRELVALNNLRSRHRIRVGQVLVLPDHARGGSTVVARAEPPADGIYRVRRGDTLSIISRRFSVSEKKLVALNSLRNRHRIAVGQRLRVIPAAAKPAVALASATVPETTPPAEAATTTVVAMATPRPAVVEAPLIRLETDPSRNGDAEHEIDRAADESDTLDPTAPAEIAPEESPGSPAIAAEEEIAAPGEVVPAPDPSDYAVHSNGRITVQADETLSHYAEWLEIRASRLRRLNRMRIRSHIVIGRRIRLDFARVRPEVFEQRRLAYHKTLQEEFFESFEVTGTESRRLKTGDSLWELAEREYRIPVWLLRQYNPDLDFGALQVGTRLVIPVVNRREG
jgi:membrane-bound lytic murein transglycosylase D